MYIYIYICIDVHRHICLYVYLYICICTHICICVYTHYIWLYVSVGRSSLHLTIDHSRPPPPFSACEPPCGFSPWQPAVLTFLSKPPVQCSWTSKILPRILPSLVKSGAAEVICPYFLVAARVSGPGPNSRQLSQH